MPTFRGVTVRVTDRQGRPLKEYGTRSLDRAVTVSTYIECESDLQFRVAVQPTFPFPISLSERETTHGSRRERRREKKHEDDHRGRQTTNPHEPWRRQGKFGSASYRPVYRDDEDDGRHQHRERHRVSERHGFDANEGRNRHSQLSQSRHGSPQRWHLLASVYLDGRKKPERRAIIHLDRDHPDFKHSGKVVMSHRWVQDNNGDITTHSWVFKEVGIETMLDKLLISGEIAAEGAICRQDEEDLLKAMSATGLEAKEESSQVGQITLTLVKVLLGETQDDWQFQALHTSSERDDINMEDRGALSHTTRVGEKVSSRPKHEPVRIINYREVEKDGNPFAVFKFYYRSKDILRKFNFKDRSPSPDLSRPRQAPARRRINDKLTSLTPLSLTHSAWAPKASSSASKKGDALTRDVEGKAKVEGITVDKKKWKDNEFNFTGMRSNVSQLEHEEYALKTHSKSDDSEAEQSEATLGIIVPPPSFRAISKSPARTSPKHEDPNNPALKRKAKGNDKDPKSQFTLFRLDVKANDEDADDEADLGLSGLSKSKHAPSSLVRARETSVKQYLQYDESEDDTGLAMDEDDQGLGESLAKVTLKRKHVEDQRDQAPLAPASPSRSEMADTSSMGEESNNVDIKSFTPESFRKRTLSEQVHKKVKAEEGNEEMSRLRSLSDVGVEGNREVEANSSPAAELKSLH